jgi:hypothetical protein
MVKMQSPIADSRAIRILGLRPSTASAVGAAGKRAVPSGIFRGILQKPNNKLIRGRAIVSGTEKNAKVKLKPTAFSRPPCATLLSKPCSVRTFVLEG